MKPDSINPNQNSLWHWNFLSWFKGFPEWDTLGWLLIIFVGAYWEITGAVFHNRTTFTDLVRHTTPIWVRAAILAVLVWHFCIAKANWQ